MAVRVVQDVVEGEATRPGMRHRASVGTPVAAQPPTPRKPAGLRWARLAEGEAAREGRVPKRRQQTVGIAIHAEAAELRGAAEESDARGGHGAGLRARSSQL